MPANILSQLTGPMNDLIGSLQKTIDSLGKFVEALAPGVMENFQRAIKDLQATIGVAFVGLFVKLADVAREVAGALLPAMEALQPVVDELADALGNILVTAAQEVASILKAVAPALQFLALLINQLSEIMRALHVVGMALFETFMELIGGFDLKKIMEELAKVVHQVIKAMLVFVATVAKLIGMPQVIDKIIKGLENAQGGATAAGQIGFKDFIQANKDIQLAALQAAGGGAAKKADLADIVAALKDVKAGNMPLLRELEWIKNIVNDILNLMPRNPFQPHPGAIGGGVAGGSQSTPKRSLMDKASDVLLGPIVGPMFHG